MTTVFDLKKPVPVKRPLKPEEVAAQIMEHKLILDNARSMAVEWMFPDMNCDIPIEAIRLDYALAFRALAETLALNERLLGKTKRQRKAYGQLQTCYNELLRCWKQRENKLQMAAVLAAKGQRPS